MKRIIASAFLMAWGSAALAGPQVWRYVDERTGEVSYSNEKHKNKKGAPVEIMEYPAPKVAVAARGAPALPAPGAGMAGSPIPAEILRQLQGGDGGAKPPSGLPPLPSLPGLPTAAREAPRAMAPAPLRPSAQTEAPAAREPAWAKEVAVKEGRTPVWAQDPFAPAQ
jgi:hypothetical protein